MGGVLASSLLYGSPATCAKEDIKFEFVIKNTHNATGIYPYFENGLNPKKLNRCRETENHRKLHFIVIIL